MGTSFSADGEVSSVDLDGDGVGEVITGTSWLSPDNDRKINMFHRTEMLPGRHEVVDIDGSGVVDAVIGYQAISNAGKLAWYRDFEPALAGRADEYVIDYPTGPMSGGTADMDGDLDIVSIGWGHSRVLLFENTVSN